MASPINPFHAAAAAAVADALGVDASLFQVGAPPKPEMGDFAVGCFPAAKVAKQAPPLLAKKVVDAFAPTDLLASASQAGPFVNFRANRDALYRHVLAGDLVPSDLAAGKTVCIDFSSPNIAKHLAYHHIRSTVIGHALANLHKAIGWRTVGINHIGDWGTTHGMLMAAKEMWGIEEPVTISVLNDLYVRFRKEMESDPSLEAKGREWFKRLEDGDPEARATWEQFRDVSMAEFQVIYDLLGIEFEEVRGESAYEDAMAGVIDMLEQKGLTSTSEGALVVDLTDEGIKAPLLLKKQDGATLYATRDLAAAMYRHDTYGFDRSLYVVARPQALHFQQLFATLKKAGFDWADQCEHVQFGLVRLFGKKAGTRKGNVVLLKQVLDEASARVAQLIEDNDKSELEGDELIAVSKVVGIGAVVFANLMSQREKDVDFDIDDVTKLDGDTGAYVQYSGARCASIMRKAGELASGDVDTSLLTADAEWALALALTQFGEVVARCVASNEPHHLCRYLLDLTGEFSHWYTSGNQDASLRVLCEDEGTRRARVALVAATRKVIEQGLGLLGIDTPERM